MKTNAPSIAMPLAIALAVCLPSLLMPVQAAEKDNPAQRYRVIFNCDGHAVAKDSKGDLNQWIENLFGPLEESDVAALFWCDGAGGNTANYDSQVLERTGARAGQPRAYIDQWIAAGNDPPAVVVREAKKRGLDVFYSFRINDIHDSFMPDELPTFKVEHPEWLIGERKYGDVLSFRTALNFAVPDVRELKFRVVEELFQKYDFDGLEIDFLRSAPYFLPGTEAKNAHLLTEFLQRVRQHLTECGQQRGRPVRLAVRVDESPRSCRLNGFDVASWIEQGLVDMVVLGSGVMDIEVGEFKQLAASKGVHVYPCLYGWPSKYTPIPAELAGGLALNYWAQGADGIYLFNWFPHTVNNSERTGSYMARLLKQLGDPITLRAGQRRLMFAADRGRPQRSYQYNWLHCVLPASLPTDEPLRVTIRVFEAFRAGADLTLELRVENLQTDDVVAVMLNGKPVKVSRRDGAGPLTASIEPEQLRVGINQVAVRLAKRSAESAGPRTVAALELHASRPVEEDWSQFRGPNCTGVSESARPLPVEFSDTENVGWSVELGDGIGSPVVAAGRVYIPSMEGAEMVALSCFDSTTGESLWTRRWPTGDLPEIHKINSHASTTPAADAERVYFYFSTLGLVALDAATGVDAWRRELPVPYFVFKWGAGMSPVLHDDLVLLCQDDDLNPALYAIDKKTGTILWRDDRSDMAVNYSHPIICKTETGDEVVVAGTGMLIGYDVASGERLWYARTLLRNIKTTPVVRDGIIYISLESGGIATQWLAAADQAETGNSDGRLTKGEIQASVGKTKVPAAFFEKFDRGDLNRDGFLEGEELDRAFLSPDNFAGARFDVEKPSERYILAVRGGGRGDVTASHVLWKHASRAPDHISSPLVVENRMFVVKGGGISGCFSTEDGAPFWSQKRIENTGEYYASPIYGDGKIYVAGANGIIVVLESGPELKILAKNDLAGSIIATPAIADGRLFVRTRDRLFCIEKR